MSGETTYTLNIDTTNLRKAVRESVDAFRDVESASQRAGKAVDRAFTEDMSENIRIQKDVIRDYEKTLRSLEKQIGNMPTGLERTRAETGRNELIQEINLEKQALGRLQTEQQNYKDSTALMRRQIQQLKTDMVTMTEGTDEYTYAMHRLGAMQQRFNEVQQQGKIFSDQFKYFNATREAVQGLTGALSAGVGVATLFGAQQEDLVRVQARLQSVMAIAIGTQQMAKVLNKDSYVVHLLLTKAKAADAATTGVLSKALVGFGVAAKTANVAARALMLTLSGGLIAIAWGVIAAINRLNRAKAENRERAEEARRANEEFNNAVASSASRSLVTLHQLQVQYARTGRSMEEVNQFIRNNTAAFDELGVSIQNVADLENLLINQTGAFIQSIFHRARAEAFRERALGEIQAALADIDKIEERIEKYRDNIDRLMQSRTPGNADFVEQAITHQNALIQAAEREIKQAMADAEERAKKTLGRFAEAEAAAIETIRNAGLTPIDRNVQIRVDETYSRLYEQAVQQSVRNHRQMELQKTRGTKEEIKNRHKFLLEDLAEQERAYRKAFAKMQYQLGITIDYKNVVLPDVFQELRDQAGQQLAFEIELFNTNQAEMQLREFEQMANQIIEKDRELKDLRNTRNDPIRLEASGLNANELTAIIEQRQLELSRVTQALEDSNDSLHKFVGEVINNGITHTAELLRQLQTELYNLQHDPDGDQSQIPELQKRIRVLQTELANAKREARMASNENAASPFERWQKTYASLTRVSRGLEDVANRFDNVSSSAQRAISTATVFVSSSLKMIDGIATLAQGTIQATQATAVGAAAAIRAVEAASVILAVIGAALAITQSIINLVRNNDAERVERQREHVRQQVAELDEAYRALERAIRGAFSADASNLINQQNQLLQQQRNLLRQQIAKEEARARDNSKGNDQDEARRNAEALRQQYNDIFNQIEDNNARMIDVMFGSDLRSAVDQFARHWVDSWGKSNEEIQRSQQDFVRNMVRGMIMQIIKSGVSEQMQRLRQHMADTVARGLVPDEVYINNAISQMQAETDAQMEKWRKWLEDPGATREAEARGIARASQESVDINNSLLTTMTGHTRDLVEISQFVQGLVSNIASDIRGAFEIVKQINENTKHIKSCLEDIRDFGIKLKNE